MTQINLAGIIKLIDASQALSPDKKAELKAKLPTLDEVKLATVQRILVEEQAYLADYYRQVGQIKTHAAEQKIKCVYDHAEKKLNLEEADDLAALENQLASLDA